MNCLRNFFSKLYTSKKVSTEKKRSGSDEVYCVHRAGLLATQLMKVILCRVRRKEWVSVIFGN
jgi:hypothetical protein